MSVSSESIFSGSAASGSAASGSAAARFSDLLAAPMGQSSVATAVRPSPAEALAQGPSCALSGNNLQGRGSGRLSAHLRSQAGDWPRSAAGKRSGFRQARLGFWQRLVGLWPFQGRLGHGDRPSQSNPLGQRRSPWKGGRPSQGRPEGTKGAGSRSL